MRLETRLEYVGSSPSVSGACQDSARGVHQKKNENLQKIVDGSRNACRELERLVVVPPPALFFGLLSVAESLAPAMVLPVPDFS
ncbi:hypothetical protein B296_00028049, partial [Ensete ventricosum]